jgi:transcriptional regulator with XRE-family HTH domain
MSVISETLRTILFELDISQTRFAEEIGVSRPYINFILHNKRDKMSLRIANAIQENFGYSSRWVLSGTGEKMIPRQRFDFAEALAFLSPDELRLVSAYIDSLSR